MIISQLFVITAAVLLAAFASVALYTASIANAQPPAPLTCEQTRTCQPTGENATMGANVTNATAGGANKTN